MRLTAALIAGARHEQNQARVIAAVHGQACNFATGNRATNAGILGLQERWRSPGPPPFQLTPPTSSWKSTFTFAAASRTTFCCTWVLKPGGGGRYFISARSQREDAIGPQFIGLDFPDDSGCGILDGHCSARDATTRPGLCTSPTMVALVVWPNEHGGSARQAHKPKLLLSVIDMESPQLGTEHITGRARGNRRNFVGVTFVLPYFNDKVARLAALRRSVNQAEGLVNGAGPRDAGQSLLFVLLCREIRFDLRPFFEISQLIEKECC